MERCALKCIERYCELTDKKTDQFYKVSTPCLHDHNFKEEELEAVGELSKACSQIVLYLARTGGLDILWSVNKQWTRACDTRLARLISYTRHVNNYRQYCLVGNTAQHCRLGLFQDSDSA